MPEPGAGVAREQREQSLGNQEDCPEPEDDDGRQQDQGDDRGHDEEGEEGDTDTEQEVGLPGGVLDEEFCLLVTPHDRFPDAVIALVSGCHFHHRVVEYLLALAGERLTEADVHRRLTEEDVGELLVDGLVDDVVRAELRRGLLLPVGGHGDCQLAAGVDSLVQESVGPEDRRRRICQDAADEDRDDRGREHVDDAVAVFAAHHLHPVHEGRQGQGERDEVQPSEDGLDGCRKADERATERVDPREGQEPLEEP